MDHGHLGSEPGQEGGLFNRGVAPAHHDNILVTEEESVTRGAPGDAASGQPLLIRQTKFAVGGAGREDYRLGTNGVAAAGDNRLDVALEVEFFGVIPLDCGAKPLGLLLHVFHEVGTHDALGEAGEVFHVCRVHQGATGGDGTGEHERIESGSGRVDGGGVSGGTGTHNHNIMNGGGSVSHKRILYLGREKQRAVLKTLTS